MNFITVLTNVDFDTCWLFTGRTSEEADAKAIAFLRQDFADHDMPLPDGPLDWDSPELEDFSMLAGKFY